MIRIRALSSLLGRDPILLIQNLMQQLKDNRAVAHPALQISIDNGIAHTGALVHVIAGAGYVESNVLAALVYNN
jgi:hypothetical protein